MYLYEFPFSFSVFKIFPSFCALLNRMPLIYIKLRPDSLFHNLIVLHHHMEIYFFSFMFISWRLITWKFTFIF